MIIAALLTSAALLAGPTPVEASSAQSVEWHACKHEDGSGQRRCAWDAIHMGNGSGDSVLIRRGGTDRATYTVVRHRRAHRLAGL